MKVRALIELLEREDRDADVLIALGDNRFSLLAGFEVDKKRLFFWPEDDGAEFDEEGGTYNNNNDEGGA